MIAAPIPVQMSGIWLKKRKPTIAEKISRAKSNGISAVASAMPKDLVTSRCPTVPAKPIPAATPSCSQVGSRQTNSAGTRVIGAR